MITPVACQLGALKYVCMRPSCASRGDCSRSPSEVLGADGGSVHVSLLFFAPASWCDCVLTLVRGCLLVMPPLILRISSASCTPSGAFGFRGLIYRSRWRPRLEEVKAWPQNGQLRSFGAFRPLAVPDVESGEDVAVSILLVSSFAVSAISLSLCALHLFDKEPRATCFLLLSCDLKSGSRCNKLLIFRTELPLPVCDRVPTLPTCSNTGIVSCYWFTSAMQGYRFSWLKMHEKHGSEDIVRFVEVKCFVFGYLS